MPLLSASNLSFAYSDQAVLRDASMTLERGEVVALIGPNGSGKSTLTRALLGHIVTTGTVRWDDRPLNQWRRRELAQTVAYLPQTPVYDQDMTVRDVLRLGRSPYLGAFGLESADDAGIVDGVANKLDLTQLLSRRMDALSGGQRQRVFVGRCLIQQPRALLLDEPNTFLDLQHQAELVRLLRTLANDGIAVLIASHDLNLAAALADRFVLLKRGAVIATGPADVVLDATLLSEVFATPLRRVDVGYPAIIPEYRR